MHFTVLWFEFTVQKKCNCSLRLCVLRISSRRTKAYEGLLLIHSLHFYIPNQFKVFSLHSCWAILVQRVLNYLEVAKKKKITFKAFHLVISSTASRQKKCIFNQNLCGAAAKKSEATVVEFGLEKKKKKVSQLEAFPENPSELRWIPLRRLQTGTR